MLNWLANLTSRSDVVLWSGPFAEISTTFEKSLFLLPFGFSFIDDCAVEACCGGCLGSWLFILFEECGLLGSLAT